MQPQREPNQRDARVSISPRVLLAKPGLDGPDRGLKTVAMALRDAGAEVIYLGLRVPPREILVAADEEDVDLVGVSTLSGAHLTIGRQLIEARKEQGLEKVPLVMGGTIPREDQQTLLDMGVDAVFPVGEDLDSVVETVLSLTVH